VWPRERPASGFTTSGAALAACLILGPGSPQAQSSPAAAPPSAGLHTPGSGVLHRESDAALEVTSVIKCICGGCVNQTLHECDCGYASQEKARIESQVQQGSTPRQLIAGYVVQHGPQVRIVPEKKGLDLVGYLVPFAATLIGIGALMAVLSAWRRRSAEQEATAQNASTREAPADSGYLDRLRQDLGKIDA